MLKECSCGWNGKRPGAKARLRYRSFVGLKPHANPNDQGIDFFSTLLQPLVGGSGNLTSMPWRVMRHADGSLASLLKTKSPAGAGLIGGTEAD